jgi:hypothetical protein
MPYIALVAICLWGSQAVWAQPSSMQFSAVERCASESAGELLPASCVSVPKGLGDGKLILASGQIEKLSSDHFAEFTQNYPAKTIVILQSLGGDLIGGLRLGQAIRARNFQTYLSARAPRTDDKTIGKCFSACAYAFLGGVERQVDPLAQFGVHQFRGQDKNLDAIQTQKLSAILGRYMDTMGVNRQLLDSAMATDPGKVQLINASLRKAWRVENAGIGTNVVLNKWRLEAASGGKRLGFATQRQRKSAASVTLAFAQFDGQTRALLIVRPDPALEGSATWSQYFAERTPLTIELVNASGEAGRSYQLSAISNWSSAGPTNTPGTRQIWFMANAEIIQQLQASPQFWVKPMWSNLPNGLDDRTLFGTSGLKDVLLAL